MIAKEFLKEARELLDIQEGLPSDQDMSRHVDGMISFYTPGGPPYEQKLLEHLYTALSSIDAKSAALFTANSVLAAVFAIFFQRQDPGFSTAILGPGLMLLLISSLVLTFCIKVHWSGTDQWATLEPESKIFRFHHLLIVRRDRTINYRRSLLMTFCSILILLFVVLIQWATGLVAWVLR